MGESDYVLSVELDSPEVHKERERTRELDEGVLSQLHSLPQFLSR